MEWLVEMDYQNLLEHLGEMDNNENMIQRNHKELLDKQALKD